jgi:hypothetical protein
LPLSTSWRLAHLEHDRRRAGPAHTRIGVGGRSRSGWAGYFEGSMIAQGNLYVQRAEVGRGSRTRMARCDCFLYRKYLELIRGLGETVLTGESVRVALGEDFAALVPRGRHQVFLTSDGPSPPNRIALMTGPDLHLLCLLHGVDMIVKRW